MDDLISMAPCNFFQLGANAYKLPQNTKIPPQKGGTLFQIENKNFTKYTLPKTSELLHEDPFAQVAIGWCKEGLEFAIHADVPSIRSAYPNFSSGDSVELMIDTRDVKTSGYNTRFCHHFFFLPEAIDGVQSGEITRFRTEDTHELCDPKSLHVHTEKKSHGYRMNLFIPASSLHGYDPEQFNRLGFTYRVNASTQQPQHFSVISGEFQIEQQPSLWSSLTLVS